MNKKLILNNKLLDFSKEVCVFFNIPYVIDNNILIKYAFKRVGFSKKSNRRKYFRYTNTLLARINQLQTKLNVKQFTDKDVKNYIKTIEKSYYKFQEVKSDVLYNFMHYSVSYEFNSDDFYK